MAKRIKGALVIIFVLVLSCLLLVGCNSTKFDANIKISNSALDEEDDYQADFELGSSNEAFEQEWKDIIKFALLPENSEKTIKVKLIANWTASEDEDIVTSFGKDTSEESNAFSGGRIFVPEDANIELNLNGKVINRNLTKPVNYGSCFLINGSLTIVDNEEGLVNAKNTFDMIPSMVEKANGIGKITGGNTIGNGGGIYVNVGAELNVKGGMVSKNYATNNGGGIYAIGGVINFFDGVVCDNVSNNYGGGIEANGSKMIVYNGIFANNYTNTHGSGISCDSVTISGELIGSEFAMYDGIIGYNKAMYGGLATYGEGTVGEMFGGKIVHNQAYNSGAGVTVWARGTFKLHNGLIKDNLSLYGSVGTSQENSGGAVLIGNASSMYMYGGEISDNIFKNNSVTTRSIVGGGIGVYANITLSITGGVIKNNKVIDLANPNNIYGGGIGFNSGISCNFSMSGDVQIYGNTVNGKENDLYLPKNFKINVTGSWNENTHIGIKLAEDYGEEVFTNGYSTYNTEKPSAYFFSSNERGKIASINNVEVKLVQTINTDKYEFVYMEEKNGKTYRQKYTDNKLIHGVNDYKCNVGGNYILGNVMPYTSVNEFVGNLNFDITKVKLYNSNGYLIYDKGGVASGLNSSILDNKYNLSVGTGWVLEVIDSTNKVVDSIKISVLGDITGDGRVNSVDITNMRSLVGNTDKYNKLTAEQKQASLVDNKGSISVVDIEILKAYINGDIDIKLYF